MALIEVLGPGCPKCKLLMERIEEATESLGGEFFIRKVVDPVEIAARGVLSTPAFSVDGVVKSQGHVPTVAAITELLSS
ncbi:MAG TPA: thioredoxin family protein [Holophagaceae bacterium]|nr:thioredoxin family protein [Holophagaceae bacterium]